VYPILFEFFGYPISTFGIMMALGFLAATALAARRLGEEGFDPDLATSMLIWCMLGGVVGAKLYYAVDVSLREGMPFRDLLFAREGLTWYGGLLGGIAAAAVGCRRYGLPFFTWLNCVCVGAAVGQALGRVGCFLVGDDYGGPTGLPWGFAFPEGAPPVLDRVHPTQLYETAWLLLAAGVLWRRRRASPFLAGEYLVWNGVGRFAIEMLRLNPRVALGLTAAQWIAIGLVASGSVGWLWFHGRGEAGAHSAAAPDHGAERKGGAA
jgi:phosphatidylglycerol:prolipoprotein diacylglycerol transferase